MGHRQRRLVGAVLLVLSLLVPLTLVAPVTAADERVLVYTGNDGYSEGWSYLETAVGKPVDTLTTMPTDLSTYSCVVLSIPRTAFSSDTTAALNTYVTGGGTILALGENSEFFSPAITTLNSLAASLGSDVTLEAANVDAAVGRDFHTTTIDPSPLTAGVDSIAYAFTSLVTVATGGTAQSLVRTAGGQTFIGADRIGQGYFVCSGDYNVFSDGDHSGTQFIGHDNGVLAANICGPHDAADTTPPVITPTVTGTLGDNDWCTSDVDVTWSVTDAESDITEQTGCEAVTVSTDTTGTTITCEATSAGGTSQQSVTITRDTTAPAVSLVDGPTTDTSYAFGAVPAAPTCDASDATSGLAGPCSVNGYSTAVGTHTVTASATDMAGNTASDSRTYTVQAWTLTGFYEPVDMNGVVNSVKAGSTVPLKFEVFAGSTELTDTSVVTMSAKQITCTSSAATDDVELVATGRTSLRYDTTGGQFIYNLQTPIQAGACYAVTATTGDGSTLTRPVQAEVAPADRCRQEAAGVCGCQ